MNLHGLLRARLDRGKISLITGMGRGRLHDHSGMLLYDTSTDHNRGTVYSGQDVDVNSPDSTRGDTPWGSTPIQVPRILSNDLASPTFPSTPILLGRERQSDPINYRFEFDEEI